MHSLSFSKAIPDFQAKTAPNIFYIAYIREYLHPPPPPREANLALAPHADVLGPSSRVDVIQFIFLCFCHDLKYIITALQYVVVKHFMSCMFMHLDCYYFDIRWTLSSKMKPLFLKCLWRFRSHSDRRRLNGCFMSILTFTSHTIPYKIASRRRLWAWPPVVVL